MTMTHPGLPLAWVVAVGLAIFIVTVWAVLTPVPIAAKTSRFNLSSVPGLDAFIRLGTTRPWFLLLFKILIVSLF